MDFEFAFGLRKRYLLGHANETVPQIPVAFECRAFRGADIKFCKRGLAKCTTEAQHAVSMHAH